MENSYYYSIFLTVCKHEDVLIFVKWLDLNTSNSQDRAQAARDYG